jgi:heat shock protein HtpX
MPRLYIIPTEAPNAFATGRNPKHAAVAATQGILKVLSKQELRGVLAHELAHVKNRDILITTIAATIAGVIGYLASMAQWAAIFGGFGGNRDDNNSLLGLLMLAILTPIIATIIQLAISRSREFLADARGASFIKDGHSLAEALEKLERSHKRIGFGSETTSSLFIVNPFKGQALWQLFSTHPPTHERIKRLRAMKF